MCDCVNGINSCESNTTVNCNEVANTPCNSVPVDSNYVSSLYDCIKDLEFKLQTAERNQNRFQALYCQALSSLLQIKEADSNIDTIKTILSGTFVALEEIEAKS